MHCTDEKSLHRDIVLLLFTEQSVDAEFGRMGPSFDSMGEFHHANTDTMDKVSRASLDIVGRTVLRTIELLDR